MIAHISNGREQTVKEHLESVSKLCGEYASKINCKNMGELIGLLHDPGKFTKHFEEYIRESSSGKKREQKPNHSSAGAKILMSLADDNSPLLERYALQSAAQCVACHHGGLCNNLNELGEDEFSGRLNPKSEIFYDEVKENLRNCGYTDEFILSLYKSACAEVDSVVKKISNSGLDRHYSYGLLEKFLFSCLIDADRYDTMCFCTNTPIEKQKNNTSLWELFSAELDKNLERFNNDSELNKLRYAISASCYGAAKRDGGIFTLSCPTGSGKTLSSLRFAVNHAKEKKKDRIFYIIPYITILDQSAKEIKENLSGGGKVEPFVESSVLELHSAVVQYEENEKTADESEAGKAPLLTERMDAPIVMTTMVRFLNTFFSGGTKNPRAIHNFANSVIIFDEIQTLPVKCVSMFNGLINFLSKICGATIVLSTATQPLLDKVSQPAKPVIFSDNCEISGCIDEAFMKFKRVNLVSCIKPEGYNAHELAAFIYNTADNEGNALAIFNTKAVVYSVFKEIEELNATQNGNDRPITYYLSTNLCPAHRKNLIEEIKDCLANNKRIIVISTQLIEAGINISFNCVFRALAGFDSLVQAAGRANRHAETELKNVYIVNPNFEDLSKLPDIKIGRDCSLRLIKEYERSGDYFDNDLLSPKTIKTYFEYYLHEQKEKMQYTVNIGTINKNLYEILSSNSDSCNAYKSSGGNNPYLILKQAFRTAADKFEAIEEYTRAVIVPYDKGVEIIRGLNGETDIETAKKLIHRAQQYSVNISEYTFKKLGRAVYPLKDTGAFALADGYYDNVYGVITEPRMGYCDA